ncbi:phosphate acyltransferase PlsX [bacterium]|nr:phosphate acyltransferase PlsX [bacterium]
MRIAIDAMGGDSAPHAEVEGAIQSIPHLSGQKLVLVGDEERIHAAAEPHGGLPTEIQVLHASQVVEMTDRPIEAMRHKRDSSIARCVELVSKGEAVAVVSAGNTGAVVAHATLKLGLLEGIRRPGIAVGMPTRTGSPTLVIDCGANVKTTPENLLQYGIMASAYAQGVFGKKKPTVGLLNIGQETIKGNDLVREARDLFEAAPLHFIGFVEGGHIFDGEADVVVCDGFVGNVLLKVSEGVADTIMALMKQAVQRTLRRRIGAMLCKYAMLDLAARVDRAELGGAPLLGVNGICLISHGGSDARAICNAVRRASEAVAHNVNDHIVASLRACHTSRPQ